MKQICAAVVGCLMLIAAASAKPVAVKDPAAAIRAIYAQLERGGDPGTVPQSARLNALMALDTREARSQSGAEVGRYSANYFTNTQDWSITDARVTTRKIENAPSRKIVVVRFKNLDQDMENHFYWERTKTGWVLDDVRSLGERGYTLSVMLKYGWDGSDEPAKKTE